MRQLIFLIVFFSTLGFLSAVPAVQAQVSIYDAAGGSRTLGMSVKRLVKLLGSERRETRENAARQLRKRGRQKIAQPLSGALKSPDWRVRYWSATILGEVRASTAVPALIYALNKDSNESVRGAAKKALKEIGSTGNRQAMSAVAMKSDARNAIANSFNSIADTSIEIEARGHKSSHHVIARVDDNCLLTVSHESSKVTKLGTPISNSSTQLKAFISEVFLQNPGDPEGSLIVGNISGFFTVNLFTHPNSVKIETRQWSATSEEETVKKTEDDFYWAIGVFKNRRQAVKFLDLFAQVYKECQIR